MEIQKRPRPLQPVASDQRLQMVEQFRRSGLTRKAFSRQYGVPLATLSWWLSKAKRSSIAPAPVTFSEIKVIGSALDAADKWAMEVESPSGVKVRCREALPARTLERLLRGTRC
jgi:transposase-like protein